MIYQKYIKKVLDIIFSLVGLIIFAPLNLIIIIVLLFFQGKPIFYKQLRYGRYGKKFCIYKFRTMDVNSENMIKEFNKEQKKEYEENFKLVLDPRVTKIGKILRRTSLDEIPQFLNILKGDMSLIGPRPIVERELEKYTEQEQNILLSVKPGLIGYWQAFATKATTYNERIQMELFYVKNRSAFFDLKIFFKSISTVIRKMFSKNIVAGK